MKMHFFTVPVYETDADVEQLNKCLAGHRVTEIRKEFVAAGTYSHWCICVTTASGQERSTASKKGRVDYREILSPEDFAVFADLRELRKRCAAKDNVPPYAVFTNEHLADMVRRQITSLAEMQTIDGIGPARIEKYGAAFVTQLCNIWPQSQSGNGTPPKATPK